MFYKTAGFKENTDYIFEATVIHSKRMKLLTYPDYEKMLENDLEGIFSILSEKKYDVSSKKTVEILLKEEEKLLKETVSSLKSETLKQYILLPYDFFNFKVIYKGWLKQEAFENLKLGQTGLIEAQKLKKIYEGEEIALLPKEISLAIKDFDKEIEEQSPFWIDLLWEKYLYRFLIQKAKEIKNEFLLKLHSLEIDLTNFLNVFRLKLFDKDLKVLQKSFIENGKLSIHTFYDLYKEEPDLITAKLFYLDYTENVKKGLEGLRKHGNLSEMEKELKRFYFSYLSRAAHVIFGYEGIIAYYWLKKFEISNLRLIMTAKENNISKEWVLTSLRT